MSTWIALSLVMLLGAGYMALGIVQMIAPARALRCYRLILPRKRFEDLELRWKKTRPLANKVMGAFYICFRSLMVWSAMNVVRHAFLPR